jgi:hypothetical protein
MTKINKKKKELNKKKGLNQKKKIRLIKRKKTKRRMAELHQQLQR